MKKSTLVKYFLLALIVAAVWLAYQHGSWFSAAWWQIKNRGTLTFGSYLIPVPLNWQVHDFGRDDRLLFRIDRDPKTLQPGNYPVTINVIDKGAPVDLDTWASEAVSGLQVGSSGVLRHAGRIDGELMLCVGTEIGPKSVRTGETPLAYDCRSTGRLELLITAPDSAMTQIWDIVSRIRVARSH